MGAGPSGSALAWLLAGRGWTVDLLDKASFPRPKPCGECLNPGAVALLGRLGLLDAVEALEPVPLEGWRIRAGGHESEGRFGRDVPGGLGVSRAALDHALVGRAQARGARLHERVRVTGVTLPPDGAGLPAVATIEPTGRRGVRTARLLVGADGLRSVVARRLGMMPERPGIRKISLTCRLEGSGPRRDLGLLHLDDGVTVGLAPVADAPVAVGPLGAVADEPGPPAMGVAAGPAMGASNAREPSGRGAAARPLWNGTVVVEANRGPEMKGAAAAFFREVFDGAGIPWSRRGYEIVGGPWPSGAFDWPPLRVARPGLLLVGDAAGYYDPLTGQGIFRALRSAELAAGAIDRILGDPNQSPAVLRRYASAVERSFRPGRRVQRIIEAVLSRRRLREAVLGRIASTPGSMDALVRVTGDVARARTLLHPRLLLALAGLPVDAREER